MNKKIAIFGSTGSIGKQSLEILPSDFKVISLTALKNAEILNEQSDKYSAEKYLGELNSEIIKKLIENANYVINAIPGFAGLAVSIEALTKGKILLTANKESLVIAGKYLKEIAEENNAEIRPLDSEASAIWQLISDYGKENVSSITLTCSGGPFFGTIT